MTVGGVHEGWANYPSATPIVAVSGALFGL